MPALEVDSVARPLTRLKQAALEDMPFTSDMLKEVREPPNDPLVPIDPLEPGEVVRTSIPKSPKMTVAGEGKGGVYNCVWWDVDREIQQAKFDIRILKRMHVAGSGTGSSVTNR